MELPFQTSVGRKKSSSVACKGVVGESWERLEFTTWKRKRDSFQDTKKKKKELEQTEGMIWYSRNGSFDHQEIFIYNFITYSLIYLLTYQNSMARKGQKT